MQISLYTDTLADADEFVKATYFYKSLQDKLNKYRDHVESNRLELQISVKTEKDYNIMATRYAIIANGSEADLAFLKLLEGA